MNFWVYLVAQVILMCIGIFAGYIMGHSKGFYYGLRFNSRAKLNEDIDKMCKDHNR